MARGVWSLFTVLSLNRNDIYNLFCIFLWLPYFPLVAVSRSSWWGKVSLLNILCELKMFIPPILSAYFYNWCTLEGCSFLLFLEDAFLFLINMHSWVPLLNISAEKMSRFKNQDRNRLLHRAAWSWRKTKGICQNSIWRSEAEIICWCCAHWRQQGKSELRISQPSTASVMIRLKKKQYEKLVWLIHCCDLSSL